MKDFTNILGNGFDLRSVLEKDELYQQVCQALPEDQRHKVQQFIFEYINSIQTGIYDPLYKMLGDKEFSTALYNLVEQRSKDQK